MFPADKNLSLRVRPIIENVLTKRISGCPFPALTIADVAAFLKLDYSLDNAKVTEEDGSITYLINAVTAWYEAHIGYRIFRQRWQQTQDNIRATGSGMNNQKIQRLFITEGPLLKTDTLVLEIFPDNFSSTTETLVAGTDYYLLQNAIVPLNTWPAVRDAGGFRLTYDAGSIDYPDNPNPTQIATAQAALEPEMRVAMFNVIGHLFENREGQKPPTRYETDAALAGITPSNAAMLSIGNVNWSLTGRSFR